MIVVKITDGLGNQMFQYAYARSLQLRIGQKVCLDVSDVNRHSCDDLVMRHFIEVCDEREYSLNCFSIKLPIVNGKKLSNIQSKMKNESKFLRYCREFGLIPRRGFRFYLDENGCKENKDVFFRCKNYYLEGYFFDRSYWKDNEDVLRREFQLKKKLNLPENIRKIIKEKNTVSLHIRRKDFLRVGRDMSDSIYYEKAIKYIRDKVERPFFMIFSDDIEWVKKNKNFSQDHMYISGRGFSDSEELVLMSKCRHHIIANSTYSYWGAWLNPDEKKIVVAPKRWRQEIIPETWTIM